MTTYERTENGMLALGQHPIAVYPALIDLTGSLAGGVMLSQLYYWASRVGGRPFYKTDTDLKKECHLTEREFQKAKRQIRNLEFVSISRKGIPAKTWYQLDVVRMLDCLGDHPPRGDHPSSDDGVPISSDDGVRTGSDDGVKTITETTAETTPETHPPCSPPTGDDAPNGNYSDQAKQVFAYWQQRLGKGKAKFTEDRQRKVQARLREGYAVEDLKRAVDGILKSPHHMGQNDQGIRYDDLELICRKGSKVEHFMGLADSKAARSAPKLKEL